MQFHLRGGQNLIFNPWFIDLICASVLLCNVLNSRNKKKMTVLFESSNINFKVERVFFHPPLHNKHTSKKCHFSSLSELNPSVCSSSLRIISSTSAAELEKISVSLCHSLCHFSALISLVFAPLLPRAAACNGVNKVPAILIPCFIFQ